jgi:hypothetical protein
MGLQIHAGSGTGTTIFHVKGKDGAIAQVELARADFEEVEDGEKLVRLAGYSDPFELTHPEYGSKQMFRLLFQVLEGEEKGARFSCMFGYSLGSKAKLTEVVNAALGRAVKPGEAIEFDELLGTRVHLMTRSEMSGKGYVTVKYVAARPAKQPAAVAAEPAPAPAKADLWDDTY